MIGKAQPHSYYPLIFYTIPSQTHTPGFTQVREKSWNFDRYSTYDTTLLKIGVKKDHTNNQPENRIEEYGLFIPILQSVGHYE